jgi:hypothetical protein
MAVERQEDNREDRVITNYGLRARNLSLQTHPYLAADWTATKSPEMSIKTTPSPNHLVVDTGTVPAGSSSPLDSLLSPRRSMFNNHASSPGSVAELELREAGLDDESDFSMVPLSARQSAASIDSNTSIKSTATHNGKENRRRTTIQSMNPSESSKSLHETSTSTSSDRSVTGNNTPFILARLESQKEQEEYSLQSHRASVDGQQKLQEEFVRIQNEIKEEDEETNITNTGIDWGMFRSLTYRFLRHCLMFIKTSGVPLYRVCL